eukprot:Skav219331  [mRNA]  locus=scaffold1957:475156:479430:- [translate_table: standard]
MPLPFPEVFQSGSHGSNDAPWKRLVCMQVLVLNWLSLGKPKVAPSEITLGSTLTSRQWRAVRNLQYLSRDGNTPEFIAASGRSASKVQSWDKELGVLWRAANCIARPEKAYFGGSLSRVEAHGDGGPSRCGHIVGEVEAASLHGAKPLVADRLVFPKGPRFDPRPFFCQSTLKRYDCPLEDGLDPGEAEVPPVVRVRAERKEMVELFKKMAASKMLKILDEGSFLPDFRSGMFAVEKDADRDRMILDGRPANLVDKPQRKWTRALAASSCLCDFELAEDYNMICSGADLKDYFYQFQVNDQRCARNVLACELTKAEVGYIFDLKDYDGSTAVGLSTLAMGDRNACEYAQCSHLALCLQKGVSQACEIMAYGTAIPRGLLQVGIVIDDLVILEAILKRDMEGDGWFAKTQSSDRLQQAHRGYDDVKLEHNPKKGFAGEACGKFWGCEVDGVKGILRSSSQRMRPCSLISLRVASLGIATIGLLEALAGSWVSILGIRRRLYCLLDLIFEPLSFYDKPGQVVRLSEEMKEELCSLAILGSLAVVNMRAQFASFVSASDASTEGIAAVRAEVPQKIVKELCRHCIKKGSWSRLLPPGQAWQREHGVLAEDEELPGVSYTSHPLWQLFARCLDYKLAWQSQVHKKIHINVLELRAHLREEMMISKSHQSLRVPYALDSQVAIGSLVKGRAASRALNAELQRTLPNPLGADLYSYVMYYLSEINRADAPTRGREIEPPDLDKPLWWDSLAAGDFGPFDEWISVHCKDFADDTPPFEELGGLAKEEVLTKVAVKRRGKRARKKAEVKESCDKGSEWSFESNGPNGSLDAEAVQELYGFPRSQFFLGPNFSGFSCPGGLDLFSGSFGVAREMIKLGAPWVLTFEWNRSKDEDLLCPSLRSKLIKLLKLRAFKSCGAAPICASFSVAVTPPVRCKRFPRGLPGLRAAMRLKVRQGNSHNDFLADLIDVFLECDIGFFVENPDTSWWWRQRRWIRLLKTSSFGLFRLCFCRFGTPWRKATRVATNTRLAGITMWCQCKKKHLQLRGNDPLRRIPMTRLAQPYPRGLSRLLAASLCEKAGWCGSEKLNVARCARLPSLRAGEAVHPGPRRWKPRTGDLEKMPMQTARTLEMEARLLAEFLAWCDRSLTEVSAAEFFQRVPISLPPALRRYGNELYSSGGALSNLRHLLIAAQRWNPMARPYMSEAWEIVERWEAVTPVKHRVPVPEVIMQAMCVMAWQLKWYAWVAATLLAFYGAGRLGEVLRCNREDLLLPGDLLQPEGSPIFLRLRSFKSQFRQPAKVQHMKVTDRIACILISKIFSRLPYDAALFTASPYQYRRRWDAILKILQLKNQTNLTPGGLRAGAAVYHYRNGKNIGDLMWLLRLRSQTTLESYLQEVAALNSLAKIETTKRHSILQVAEVFPFLVAGPVQQSQDK